MTPRQRKARHAAAACRGRTHAHADADAFAAGPPAWRCAQQHVRVGSLRSERRRPEHATICDAAAAVSSACAPAAAGVRRQARRPPAGNPRAAGATAAVQGRTHVRVDRSQMERWTGEPRGEHADRLAHLHDARRGLRMATVALRARRCLEGFGAFKSVLGWQARAFQTNLLGRGAVGARRNEGLEGMPAQVGAAYCLKKREAGRCGTVPAGSGFSLSWDVHALVRAG
eukprot:359616-Chlamydomonas_euryale.AAC.3